VVLARALGPTDRGTVAFITVTALVASQLAMLGVSDATRVLGARSPALRPALLANVTLVSLAGAAIVGICIAVVLELIPGMRPAGLGERELVILALATTAVASVGAGFAFLQGCGRFKPYSHVQASAPWVYAAALALADATVGLTVARAAIIWTVAQALSGIRLLWAGGALAGWTRPDLDVLRESVQFGARAWVGSTSRMLNARTDQIITGIISTEATLGIYAVAVNASEILYYLPVAAGAALLPAVAGGEESTRLERTLRVYRAVLLITLAVSVVAVVVGPLMLPLVFGSAYRPAIGPFLILVPSGIGFATMSVFSGATLGSLAPGRSSLGPLAALLSQTILDLILIPTAGARGAAAAASAALLIAGAVAVATYRARFPFAWRLLLPRRRDLNTITQIMRSILRRPAVTPS
jgi:O-antigen/teichoic acid export membrane protein